MNSILRYALGHQAANAVIDQIDRPGELSSQQQVGEPLVDVVVFKDAGFRIDAVFALAHGREHDLNPQRGVERLNYSMLR